MTSLHVWKIRKEWIHIPLALAVSLSKQSARARGRWTRNFTGIYNLGHRGNPCHREGALWMRCPNPICERECLWHWTTRFHGYFSWIFFTRLSRMSCPASMASPIHQFCSQHQMSCWRSTRLVWLHTSHRWPAEPVWLFDKIKGRSNTYPCQDSNSATRRDKADALPVHRTWSMLMRCDVPDGRKSIQHMNSARRFRGRKYGTWSPRDASIPFCYLDFLFPAITSRSDPPGSTYRVVVVMPAPLLRYERSGSARSMHDAK